MESPADFGPIYFETDLSRFPAEPWNTFSNIAFLVVLVIFAVRTRFALKRYPLTVSALPILLIGFVGGTVFHATRSARIWLILDFMPILILSLMAAAYLWHRITKRWIYTVLLIVCLVILPRSLIWNLDIPRGLRITVGYGFLALTIIVPAVINSAKLGWRYLKLLISIVVIFSLALFCRWFDQNGAAQYLPMGSHFLWHILGAVSTGLMIEYIFRLEQRYSETFQHREDL